MKIGIKKRGTFGVKRIWLDGTIEKIEKKTNPVNPKNEGLSVFFRGVDGIGVISFSPKEVEMFVAKSSYKKKLSDTKEDSKVKKARKKRG